MADKGHPACSWGTNTAEATLLPVAQDRVQVQKPPLMGILPPMKPSQYEQSAERLLGFVSPLKKSLRAVQAC